MKYHKFPFTGEEYAVDFTYDENLFNALKAKVHVARVGALKTWCYF